VPSLRFLGQPFRDEDTAGAFLTSTLADPGLDSLTIVAAWARFGGLRRFRSEFEDFRERGGRLRLIAGIDEGVATRPGLALAIELADQAYVFHDRGARTFHPKLYLGEGPGSAVLLVGSSNVTAGGLFSNYEASLEARFELPVEAEAEALVGAREYVAKLIEDQRLCLPLDFELLDRLASDPRYAIAPGEGRRSPARSRPAGIEPDEVDQDARPAEAGEEIFGASRHEKTTARALPAGARAELEALEAEVVGAGDEEPGRPSDPPPPPPSPLTWTKLLNKTDAQHPPSPNSNPVGNLRLTKAGHEIDWLTWFRREMFGQAAWSPGLDRRGNPIEVATVRFEVTIAGRSLGPIDLEVDHAPHREEGQANHATVLHWGPLSPELRTRDYSGHTLTVELRTDGSHRLDIAKPS
jgi:hypothetical protein